MSFCLLYFSYLSIFHRLRFRFRFIYTDPVSQSSVVYIRFSHFTGNLIISRKIYRQYSRLEQFRSFQIFQFFQLLLRIISSKRFLNESNDGAILSPVGRRFHFCMTRYEKKECRCLLPFSALSFTNRAHLSSLLSRIATFPLDACQFLVPPPPPPPRKEKVFGCHGSILIHFET